MYISLSPGLLGIHTGLPNALELAARHGFVGVDSSSSQLAALRPDDVVAIKDQFASLNLRAGYFCLNPVVISAPDDAWHCGVETLKAAAPIAKTLGFSRSIAVVLPFSETLNFEENLGIHLARFGEILPILEENGIALGIEYVAPLTRRADYEHHFIYDLRGALELIDSANASNLGLLLDSFHWFCAGESVAQIAALSAEQIVAVHLGDAIKGRSREAQMSFERELPGDSGEIDLAAFSKALKSTGYEGPLTCEPMNKSLNELDDEQATARTFVAMKKTIS